jgi:hypothetical protein
VANYHSCLGDNVSKFWSGNSLSCSSLFLFSSLPSVEWWNTRVLKIFINHLYLPSLLFPPPKLLYHSMLTQSTKLTAPQLTSWDRILIEKLIIIHLVKKLFEFYETRMFITVFTKACHWTTYSHSRIKFTSRTQFLKYLFQYYPSFYVSVTLRGIFHSKFLSKIFVSWVNIQTNKQTNKPIAAL